MQRLTIVKQSDVNFGTATHFADDWFYGRKALCGKTMRATADEWEIGRKRVCGTCAKIMNKRVEAAHAEALLTQIELDHAEALQGLCADNVRCPGLRDHAGRCETLIAGRAGLLELGRDLGLSEHALLSDTEDLRELVLKAEALEDAKSAGDVADFDEEAVYAQAATTEHAYTVTCAPTHDHPQERSWTVNATSAAVAQERVCAQNNLTWSHIHAGLIRTVDTAEQENVDCPPVCEHGAAEDEGCPETPCVSREGNAFLLGTEYNFVIDFEQEFVNGLRAQGVSFSRAQEAVRALRRGGTNVTLAVQQSDELLTEYDRLTRKHGGAIPFAVRDEESQATVCAGHC